MFFLYVLLYLRRELLLMRNDSDDTTMAEVQRNIETLAEIDKKLSRLKYKYIWCFKHFLYTNCIRYRILSDGDLLKLAQALNIDWNTVAVEVSLITAVMYTYLLLLS